jgi:phenylacetic acid degradation operon negative regulatory protein
MTGSTDRPIRAGSLVVTLFGDIVAPRGGALAYAGLAELAAPFAINDSQLRTALSRLVAEEWLVPERQGKRAFYALTPAGLRRTQEAERRIYAAHPAPWDGAWCVALLADLAPARREAIRRALAWLGFGTLGPQTLLHPAPDAAALGALLADLPASERPLIVDGPGRNGAAARALVKQGWDLDALAAGYRAFLDGFAALDRQAKHGLSGQAAVAGRIRLVHEFRRLALRDPLLPAELLPRGWIGSAARRFAGTLYARLRGPSDAWIAANLANADGPLPAPAAFAAARFTGDMSQNPLPKRRIL